MYLGEGQSLDATWILDMDLRFKPNKVLELGVGVHNLFDAYPDALSREDTDPVSNRLSPFSQYTPYGFDGRFAYLRASASFN